MKKIMRFKSNTVLLLITAIVVLCIGFVVVGCGKDPQLKTDDPDKGQYALDFSDCPESPCSVTFSNAHGVSESIEATPITLEAWIKPKNYADATIIKRMVARGAALKTVFTAAVSGTTSTPATITPRFEIRRSPGTGTVAYTVDGPAIALNVWTHIAGILTNQDHSDATGHPLCTGVDGDATDDPWHLDIYQGGTVTACAETYGAAGDSTSAANAYAHEPAGTLAVMAFDGIMDEARIWNTERSVLDCMYNELGLSGSCSRLSGNLVFYSRFNTGLGHNVVDWSGIFGSGIKEYGPSYLEWSTGWTTDTPTLSAAD